MSPAMQLTPDLFARLADGPSAPSFGDTLLRAANLFGAVSEVFVFRWANSAQPELLTVSGLQEEASKRAHNYISRYFRHDPMLFHHRKTAVGKGFAESFKAGEIAPREYQKMCFEKPGLAEKLSFGWRWDDELVIANFYTGVAGKIVLHDLLPLAYVTLGLCRSRELTVNVAKDVDWLDKQLKRLCPDLSEREQQVCIQTMVGRKAGVIAKALGIKISSVYTYRRRAYLKLGVSRAGEVISALVTQRQ
jgi:DNA-binding CsgD family transcriptional regulator